MVKYEKIRQTHVNLTTHKRYLYYNATVMPDIVKLFVRAVTEFWTVKSKDVFILSVLFCFVFVLFF